MIDWTMVVITFASALAGILVVVFILRLARSSRSVGWPLILGWPVGMAIAEIIKSQWSLSGAKQIFVSTIAVMACIAIAQLIAHRRRQVL